MFFVFLKLIFFYILIYIVYTDRYAVGEIDFEVKEISEALPGIYITNSNIYIYMYKYTYIK